MVTAVSWISSPLRQFFGEITVEPVLFLYMLSIFSQYSLFQDLVYSKVCWAEYDDEICEKLHEPEYKAELDFVQESSSYWILRATLATGIPAVFMAIYLGSWSDRFGRKWPVAIPPLGGLASCVVYITISFVPTAPVALICFASFLSGLTGGFVSCIMSCMTYVSSVTSDENRTVRVSRLEAMIYLGGTIGPFISGSILPYVGHGYAFVFMLICYGMAFFYTMFFVRDIKGDDLSCEEISDNRKNLSDNYISVSSEMDCSSGSSSSRHSPSPSPTRTLADDFEEETKRFLGERTPLRIQKESSWFSKYFSADHFISAVKTCCKRREENRRFYILAVISAGFITMMITSGELDVAYLFTKDLPLVWTYRTYAYYLGYKFGLGAIALLILMPLFQRLNFSDASLCNIGIISRMAGLVSFGFSNTTWMAFLAPIISIFSFFTIPSVRALLSKLVLPSEQGKMFAFIAIAEDLCSMTASLLFNSIYPLTRNLFYGFVFQMAACILLLPLLIMWCVQRRLDVGILLTEVPTPSIVTAENLRKDLKTQQQSVQSLTS